MVQPSATALASRSEGLAARLPALVIAAERVAATVTQGIHGRRRVGLGETFWQFRGYEPGDPPQRIDWRRSARSDRVFIRQTEWEASQTVWLWRDGSPSMHYRSSPNLPEKRHSAELLLLALAYLLLRGGERVGLMGGSGPVPSSSLTVIETATVVPLPPERRISAIRISRGDVLWTKLRGHAPPGRLLRRPDPERCEGGRLARGAAHKSSIWSST